MLSSSLSAKHTPKTYLRRLLSTAKSVDDKKVGQGASVARLLD